MQFVYRVVFGIMVPTTKRPFDVCNAFSCYASWTTLTQIRASSAIPRRAWPAQRKGWCVGGETFEFYLGDVPTKAEYRNPIR